MMRKICYIIFSLLLPLCSAQSAQAQIISIAGSSTVKAFIEPAAKAYRRIHPEVIINVSGGGSGVGAASISDGRSTLGMMSRELEDKEAARMHDIEQVRIGYDAVAVVVSDPVFHQGDVHALSKVDVAAIYRGEIRNWQAVGGADRRILLIDKEKQRGTRHVFARYILGDARADASADAVIVGPNRDMKTLLHASDQAIGFLPFGLTDEYIHAVELIDKGRSYAPDARSVRDGSYPLARSLYILHRKDIPSYAVDFIHFLLSSEGQSILKKTGYIPLH